MDTTRRRLLGAAGVSAAAVALGGCLSGETPTRDRSDDAVAVEHARVRPAVVALNSPDSYGVYGQRTEQYLIAGIAVDDPTEYTPEEFAVQTPDSTYEATTDIGESRGRVASFGDAYGVGDGEAGWLAFEVPKPLDSETATLVWDGGDYAFGPAVIEQLNRPPTAFEVSFETPDSVALGEEVTATATIQNVGDDDGTFVGALNRVGPRIAYAPETAIVREIAAGDTEEWTHTYSFGDPKIAELEDPRVRLHLRSQEEHITRETAIETDGSGE